jgi:hypothetical protein
LLENRSLLKVGLDPGNVAFGSSTEIGACDNEVRFTLELGHRAMLSSQHLFGCAK